ncbi:MAG: DUF502 domain-containing protein [Verrucomicrobiota bacterium JB022]|nr:DUF502 domain-containing protein [Verrucomicrobiota bacterium JB022]
MLLKPLRNWFISGLLLLAPVGVTLFVFNLLIKRVGVPVREMFDDFIRPNYLANPFVELGLNIASVFLVVLMVAILGWFSQLLLGRFLVNTFERIVDRLPVVRSLYNSVKQIRDTFVQQQKAVFQKAVLIEYPRKGVWVLGFLTSDGRGEVQHKTEAQLINIFVPTTPNPTSGFLLMVPSEEVIELEMSIADAMKVIISGGAVVPRYDPVTGESIPAPAPVLPSTPNKSHHK